MTCEVAVGRPKELSRRAFLKSFSAVGAVVVATQVPSWLLPASQSVSVESSKINRNQEDQQHSADLQPNEYRAGAAEQVASTVVEASVFSVAKLAAVQVGKAMGIKPTSYTPESEEKMNEFVRNNPIEAYALMGMIGPAIEEAMLRLAPSLVTSLFTKGSAWGMGVATSIIFSYLHRAKGTPWTPDISLINKFFAGLLYWKYMRERGFFHAWLGHATNNIHVMNVFHARRKFEDVITKLKN